jgi:hypothetical protein
VFINYLYIFFTANKRLGPASALSAAERLELAALFEHASRAHDVHLRWLWALNLAMPSLLPCATSSSIVVLMQVALERHAAMPSPSSSADIELLDILAQLLAVDGPAARAVPVLAPVMAMLQRSLDSRVMERALAVVSAALQAALPFDLAPHATPLSAAILLACEGLAEAPATAHVRWAFSFLFSLLLGMVFYRLWVDCVATAWLSISQPRTFGVRGFLLLFRAPHTFLIVPYSWQR